MLSDTSRCRLNPRVLLSIGYRISQIVLQPAGQTSFINEEDEQRRRNDLIINQDVVEADS
jgi:hypothetical protein